MATFVTPTTLRPGGRNTQVLVTPAAASTGTDVSIVSGGTIDEFGEYVDLAIYLSEVVGKCGTIVEVWYGASATY